MATLVLTEIDGKTAMTFTITGLPQDMHRSIDEGWTSAFDNLAGHLAAVRP